MSVSYVRVLVLLAVVGVLASGAGLTESPISPGRSGGDHAFTLSADPSVTVLSVVVTGGRKREKRVMEVFGDGRMSLRVESPQGRHVAVSFERWLAYAEVVELMREALDHGLLEASRESIGAELRERAGEVLFKVYDGGRVIVDLRLDRVGTGAEERRDVHHRVMHEAPAAYLEMYPGIRALEGLELLRARQASYFEAEERAGGGS